MTMCPDARQAEFDLVLEPLQLRAGETLCDVPAGAGYLWHRVKASGVRYVGAEPSNLFASLFPSDHGAVSMRCPARAIDLPNASIDHLVSLAGLHHEPDLPTIFHELRRVLRPGSTAVIVDVEAGTSTDRFLNGFVADHNPMGHDGVFLNERTAPALQEASFQVLEDAVHAVSWSFADRAEMGAFLQLLFGVGNATPTATAKAAETILGIEDRGDGGIRLAWPLRRIVCRAV